MKAIVYTRFGSPDVLQFKDVEQPHLEENRVLVKVQAASINALDYHGVSKGPLLMRLLGGNGVRKPKDPRLGADFTGRVEAVGSAVTQFKPGDEVFGIAPGAFAEYACALEKRVALKPANLSFAAAAAVPVAAITALQGLRDAGQIQAGQQVVIQGAGGGVGMFAVQLAKAFGAEVTAVCGTKNVETMRSLGADHIIDYTQADFTRNGQRYDLILAVNGYHPLLAYRRALRRNGKFVMIGAAKTHLMRALLGTLLFGRMVSKGKRFMIADVNTKDLEILKGLIEAGKVTPVIDRSYPLAETADALRYVEEGHVRGKVVITVDQHAPLVP